MEHYQHAIEIDPACARAYWGLAQCCGSLIFYGGDKTSLNSKQIQATNKAQELGFQPPAPWIVIRRSLEQEDLIPVNLLAEESREKILQADTEWGNFADRQLAQCLTQVRLFDMALSFEQKYQESTYLTAIDGNELLALQPNLLANVGQFEKAISLWSEGMAASPDDPILRGWRAMLYSRSGQYQKAAAGITILDAVWSQHFTQVYHHYWLQELEDATQIFDSLMRRRNFSSFYRSWGCLLLRDIDRGIDCLDQSKDYSWTHVSWIFPDSVLAELAKHARYQERLEKFGINDQLRTNLIEMVRELGPTTGIHLKEDPPS